MTLDLIGRDGGAVLASIPMQSYAVASDEASLWILDVFGRLAAEPIPPR